MYGAIYSSSIYKGKFHKGKVTKYASIPANSYDDIGSVSPYGAIYQVL